MEVLKTYYCLDMKTYSRNIKLDKQTGWGETPQQEVNEVGSQSGSAVRCSGEGVSWQGALYPAMLECS